jgi:hypothetical protein
MMDIDIAILPNMGAMSLEILERRLDITRLAMYI